MQAELSTIIDLVRKVAMDLPDEQAISEDTRFTEDIGMESVNRLMLMTLLEQECGIDLEKHLPSLVELQTIGDAASFINSLKGEQ